MFCAVVHTLLPHLFNISVKVVESQVPESFSGIWPLRIASHHEVWWEAMSLFWIGSCGSSLFIILIRKILFLLIQELHSTARLNLLCDFFGVESQSSNKKNESFFKGVQIFKSWKLKE